MNDREPIQTNSLFAKVLDLYHFIHFFPSGFTAVGYLLLLWAAEYLIAENKPQIGLALHALILSALLLHSALVHHPNQRPFLLALSLAPLIRLISLLMPLKLIPNIYWYPIVAIPLFVSAFLIIRIAGITRRMTGLVWSGIRFQALVSLSGLVLGYLEYMILRPAPMITGLRWGLVWLPALILLIFTGLLEELIFRGLLQSTALTYLGRYAILYVAGVFAVLHLGYRSVLDLAFVFGVALFFGYIVKHSGSILGVTIAHGLINVMLYLIFPFLLIAPVTSQRTSVSVTPPTTPVNAQIETNPPPAGPTLGALAVLPDTPTSPAPIILPNITLSPTEVYILTPTQTPIPALKQAPIQLPTRSTSVTPIITPEISHPIQVLQVTPGGCSQAIPTRLRIGQKAEVEALLNLRIEPGMDKAIISANAKDSRLEIIGGPVCLPYPGGIYRWWNVRLPSGMTGWSVEGATNHLAYYLSPIP